MTGTDSLIQQAASDLLRKLEGSLGIRIIDFLIHIGFAILIAFILIRIIRYVFRKRLRSTDRIRLRFTENAMVGIVILILVFWVIMSHEETASFGKILFQGTAVMAAIVGFAAQTAIADVICGFILSASKPFNIGDRIELEDGTGGVVTDITLRHVALKGPDTQVFLLPNSKLNAMRITNMSYRRELRSIFFRFDVAFGSDLETAMRVIKEAIGESPYTVKGRPDENGTLEYAPVYFMEFGESSLVLKVTVYYEPDVRTEIVRSDVNVRVKQALDRNGIEIPYPHMDVIMQKEA